MKLAPLVCLFAILISAVALGQTNPVPIINQPLVPDTATPGGPAFKLTVNGTGFVSNALVNWNGQPLTTTFLSRSKVTAMVPASNIAKNGTASITVANPAPGGGTSNVMYFDIAHPVSTLTFATLDTSFAEDYSALLTADFNGDGILDLAGLGNDELSVQLGNGDGSFQMPTYYSTGSNPQAVLAADLNGDGKLDLVATNYGDNTISVYLGNGDGSFQTQKVFATGFTPFSLAAGDFNRDGKLDLAVGCNGNGTDSGSISILLGNGDGTFQEHVDYVPPGTGLQTVNAMTMGDFNGDNKLDVALSNDEAGVLYVLQGNGDGTFQFMPGTGTVINAVWMLAADVNRDGKLDLIMAQQQIDGQIAVFLGNGDGTFQSAVEYATGGEDPIMLVAADFNADGKLDLAAPNANSGTVAILLGNGNGKFQSPIELPVPPDSGSSGPFAIAAGDFNGDGKLDMAALNSTDPLGYHFSVLLQGNLPALALTPQALSFGQQGVGTTSQPQVVILTNTGTATLTLSNISVTGANASDFAETNNCGPTLAPNANCQASVTFTPTEPGNRTAALSVTDNGPGSPQSVSLSGTGVGPAVTLVPSSIDFGNQTVGITSKPQVSTLTNTGNGTLKIVSIGITGTNGSDFAEGNNCPSSIPPNGSCTIRVTFTPSATGVRNANVSITDNAPGSPQTIALTGVGVLPAVTFLPTSLTFSDQTIFTRSHPKRLKLTNSGLGMLLIGKISVTGPFVETDNCPKSLNPNAKCTINVRFHPMTEGVQNGSLNVTDNAPGSPQQVPLTGTGTALQFTPAKLDFGTQPLGTRSLPKRIAMTNKGSAPVNITGITIAGMDSGDFSEINNCGSQLASGASCFIRVRFKPTQTGKRTADVSVSDNGGGSPQQVPLSGTGT